MNQLAVEGHLNPCMSRAFSYAELPMAHQLMYENQHPHGNMSILIGAKEFGMGATEFEKLEGCVTCLSVRIRD